MKQLKCEIGENFGLWNVIDNNVIMKHGHSYVLVKCKCGKEQLLSLSDLKNNRTQSCKRCSARSKGIDIKIGDKYKEWLVIAGPKISQHGNILWKVECSCKNNTRWIQANELTNKAKCFKCSKCAAIDRGLIITKHNGRRGDLTISKYSKIKRTAKVRNIYFNVSIDFLWSLYIQQNKKCAITGDDLPFIMDASLDRIDSTKGYIESNVQWVSKQANLSKHTMTMKELREFCKKVLNNANQQPSLGLTSYEGPETNFKN